MVQTLCWKIARLVAECGWNQEAFAGRAGLHRHTARQILANPGKKLRNHTVRRIADAFGLTVHELTDLPLAALLTRVRGRTDGTARPTSGAELALQPALRQWLEANPRRNLSKEDVETLLSIQGTGGPLTVEGVEHAADRLHRARRIREQVEAIAGTEYLELLEQLVGLLFEKIQPYRPASPPRRRTAARDTESGSPL